VREAVGRYLPTSLGNNRSARAIVGTIRRRLVAIARAVHRDDLAALLDHPVAGRE
jgi:ABC-type lipopolysaccharide export system ATPase subunit